MVGIRKILERGGRAPAKWRFTLGPGRKPHLIRYAPHVLAATFFVAIFPLLAVFMLESSGRVTSPVVATVIGVGLSVGIARVGSLLWMRHSGSQDLVFGDLMLWGWLRRMRTESRLSKSMAMLGLDGSGARVREVEISAERQNEILRGLATALETGDPFTHGHTRRVTRYSYMLAKTMRLSPEQVNKIRAAASIHDVGKIETPSEVLNKPGALTDEEYEIMKRHSTVGAAMVEQLGDPEITAMVRHHHERLDGKGYPDNLAGDEIPLGARVIAVADTFDAIISTRPYRSARRHKDAIEILEKVAGTQLDERAVYAFLSYYSGRKPLAWWLSFSAGFQRVLGGMGGWLQHAQAASHGTLSLAAAVALTSAAVTIPALHMGDADRRVENSKNSRTVAGESAQDGLLVSDTLGGYDIAPGPGLDSPRSRWSHSAQEDARTGSDALANSGTEVADEDQPTDSMVASTDPQPPTTAPADTTDEDAPNGGGEPSDDDGDWTGGNDGPGPGPRPGPGPGPGTDPDPNPDPDPDPSPDPDPDPIPDPDPDPGPGPGPCPTGATENQSSDGSSWDILLGRTRDDDEDCDGVDDDDDDDGEPTPEPTDGEPTPEPTDGEPTPEPTDGEPTDGENPGPGDDTTADDGGDGTNADNTGTDDNSGDGTDGEDTTDNTSGDATTGDDAPTDGEETDDDQTGEGNNGDNGNHGEGNNGIGDEDDSIEGNTGNDDVEGDEADDTDDGSPGEEAGDEPEFVDPDPGSEPPADIVPEVLPEAVQPPGNEEDVIPPGEPVE